MTSLPQPVGICIHRPALVNYFCLECDALVIAATELPGRCGHIRRFPPGFTWAPRSWCSACRGFQNFGTAPAVVREPTRPPFWAGEFTVTERRPLSVHEIGRSLGWPNVSALHRRLGTVDRAYWYRWRNSGLDVFTADALACNANLHPIDVWGMEWEKV